MSVRSSQQLVHLMFLVSSEDQCPYILKCLICLVLNHNQCRNVPILSKICCFSDSNKFIREILLHLELSIEVTVGTKNIDFTGVSLKLHVSADPFSLPLPAQCVGFLPHFQQPWRLCSSMFLKSQFNPDENSFPGMAHRTMVSIRPVASGCCSS